MGTLMMLCAGAGHPDRHHPPGAAVATPALTGDRHCRAASSPELAKSEIQIAPGRD
jgi:hypothetical protein